jgi:luciferase-like monooxygenase
MKFMMFVLPPVPGTLEERQHLRPIGRNNERYQQMLNEVRQLVVLAEDAGFDVFATTEHHFHSEGYEASVAPLLLYTDLAARTERIKFASLGLGSAPGGRGNCRSGSSDQEALLRRICPWRAFPLRAARGTYSATIAGQQIDLLQQQTEIGGALWHHGISVRMTCARVAQHGSSTRTSTRVAGAGCYFWRQLRV